MLCFVTLRHVTLRYVTLRYSMLCYVVLCYYMFYCAILDSVAYYNIINGSDHNIIPILNPMSALALGVEARVFGCLGCRARSELHWAILV